MKRNWKTIKKSKSARNPVAFEMLVTKRDFYTTKINNKMRKENRKKVNIEEEYGYEDECDCVPGCCQTSNHC